MHLSNTCVEFVISHCFRSSEEEKEVLHQQNVVNVIQGEGLLSVIKVMCDWMMCNSSVIMTCAQVRIKLFL